MDELMACLVPVLNTVPTHYIESLAYTSRSEADFDFDFLNVIRITDISRLILG